MLSFVIGWAIPKRVSEPGGEESLDPARRFLSHLVVAEPQTGAERAGNPQQHFAHQERQMVKPARRKGRAVFVRQYGRCLRRELKAAVAVVVEISGRRLAVKLFTHPALRQV